MDNSPIILFRPDSSNRSEYFSLINSDFPFEVNRVLCRDRLVIGRYSVLPYYEELEVDLSHLDSHLVNSYNQHLYIAKFRYYEDMYDLTFPTWRDLTKVPDQSFPVVVKGETNSRKHRWNTQMYASTRRDAAIISHELKDDLLIGQQAVIYRKYIPLRVLEEGLNGIKFTNEWRFFIYKGNVVDYGFYWSQVENPPTIIKTEALALVDEVIKRVSDQCNFYVVDVAEKENGGWLVVELNDGQMSGLSLIDPDRFYKNLFKVVKNEPVTKLSKFIMVCNLCNNPKCTGLTCSGND